MMLLSRLRSKLKYLIQHTAAGQLAGNTKASTHDKPLPAAFILTPEARDHAANGQREVGPLPLPASLALFEPPCGDPRNTAELIINAIAWSKYERDRAQFYQRHFELGCW